MSNPRNGNGRNGYTSLEQTIYAVAFVASVRARKAPWCAVQYGAEMVALHRAEIAK